MKQRYPTILQGFGLFGLFIVISLIMGFAIMSLSFMGTSLATLIGTLVSMILILLIALNFKEARYTYLFAGRVPASPLVYGVAALFALFLVLVLDPILSLIPMPEFIKELFREAFHKDVFSYLTIGIVAPVLEELLFRKIILEGFEENYGAKKAIIWSAVLFAIFHFNPWQGVGAFFIGLLLGWIYLKTRDIWACIFVHFFVNSLAFLAFILSDDPFYSAVDMVGENYYALALVMGISLTGMYICYRILNQHFKIKGIKAIRTDHDELTEKTTQKP